MKMKIIVACCAALWLASACVANKSVMTDRPMPEAYDYQPVDEESLSQQEVLVVGAAALMRLGVPPEGGMVTLAPDAGLDFIAPAEGMKATSNSITGVLPLEDGSVVMEILHLYGDDLGRTQGVLDRVRYMASPFTPEERQAVVAGLIQDGKAAMASGDAEMINYHTQKVKAFQAQAGLSADGVLGPKTAEAMADAMGKVEILGVQSVPVYTETPRFEVYMVKESDFKSAVAAGQVPQGFMSLAAVRNMAITPIGEFRQEAASCSDFVALVYFMDQVSKGTALQVAFSGSPTQRDTDRNAAMQTVYAAGQDWPVLVVPVNFSTLPPQLYLQLRMDGKVVDSVRM